MKSEKVKVYVPGYGAGLASYIEDKDIVDNDKINIYIFIELILNEINLYIPENKVVKYRVRDLTDISSIEKAMSTIKEIPASIEEKWSKRYRYNNEKIDSGNILSICEVLRDLYYLKKIDSIPRGEKNILFKAESMLASEISLAYDISLPEAIKKIKDNSK